MTVILTAVSGFATAATTPQISVSDVTVAAPSGGETTRVTFVVTLSEASTKTVKVRYRTAEGSAVAGADFLPVSGTLTFSPGETSKTVTVTVEASPVPATEKVFYLQLFDAENATIGRPQGTATIVDNLPTVTVLDTYIAEPPPGEVNEALFPITLSAPTTKTVKVPFTTADGSAVAGEDYKPVRGELTFRPGEASKTVSVPVRNDLISSPDQIFWLELSPPLNAQLARAAGQATIVETNRIIAINDTAILQPPPGVAAEALFQVVLSEPTSGSTQPVAGYPTSIPAAVDFATADGSAVAGLDYVPVAGTLVFEPGEAVKTIAVPVTNSGIPGYDRSFALELSNARNATLARTLGTATIVATNRTVTIEDTSTTDAAGAGKVATFMVSLSYPGAEPVAVRYATANGTALAGSDYVAQSGTIVFPPGQISTTISVPILNDRTDETPGAPETFYVDLSDSRNATIARARATGTILDDTRVVSVEDSSVMADPALPGEALVTVSVTEAAVTPVHVRYTTVDGTAAAPADYQAASGTVTVAPGQTTAVIAVPIQPRPSSGPDRTFSVRLSDVVNGSLVRDQATVTIVTRGRGYWIAATDGGMFSFGSAPFYGSTGSIKLNQPIVGMSATPSGQGYWLVAADGGIFNFGDARFSGSTGGIKLNQPIVGMAATPSGQGYWLVAADGGIFSFGDARFHGSAGNVPLNSPIVGMAASPTGDGYWLAAADGGIFAYGDAKFAGSPASRRTTKEPIVGIAASPTGDGYWLVAADGAIFAYGRALSFGSTADIDLKQPIVGMTPTVNGTGYWLVAADGGIFSFGDARFFGSAAKVSAHPAVGIARAR